MKTNRVFYDLIILIISLFCINFTYATTHHMHKHHKKSHDNCSSLRYEEGSDYVHNCTIQDKTKHHNEHKQKKESAPTTTPKGVINLLT